MDSTDLSDDVASLERRIEDLAASAERSRRLALIARVSATAAGLWLVAGTFALVPLEATGLVMAIGIVLGGIVLAGSSRSTADELDATIRKAEAERSRLIDSIDPSPVDPRFEAIEPLSRTLH
jgi:ABC-type transport system involved in cytochrome c biogenesis ATPase subunit